MEATECGAAALGIILAYHGRYVPLEELRVECRVSRDGSNALYVKKTAEKYGLVGRGDQMTIDALRAVKPPFLVFWELNHFLVVEGFGRGRVYLSDPASGRRSVDEAAFRASYTGIVFRFQPGPNFMPGGARPSTARAVWRRMRGARPAIVYVILAGLVLTACDLVVASYNRIFIDQILVEERRTWIRPLLLAMALTAAFRVLAGALQQNALRRLKLGLALTHSARFLWHVLRLPVAFYQQRFAGEVSARVDGNSLVADLISGPLANTAVGLLMVAFYAALMFAFDPWLTAVGVVIGCVNVAAIAAADRRMADENLKIKQVRGRLHGAMMRAVQMIETIKAGAMESAALVRLSGLQARVTNSAQVVAAVGACLIALPPFLLLLTTAAVLWMGGRRVIDGAMSVGALLAFQTLMINFNRPFGDLVRLGSSVQSLQAELARLDDVAQCPCDPVFEPAAITTPANAADAPRREPPRRLTGHLVLKDVTFGYNRTIDEPLIRRFSLEVAPGSRVALVGASGSGKSTIGRLVAGLYRPWEGEILYDGCRLDEVPREVFTSQVALVDDQTFLFSGTVRDNLTLWDETIPDRDIHRAAIDAGLHGDLIRRRGGYHAVLAEGASNLSGGQRQRLEIARGLIRNPALIVLDEATSALDPITEALVDDNLRRRGCTCLIIAHRLSTIRDCDEILVLRHGRVVQRGTHDELMAEVGDSYHELQTLQQADEPDTGPARTSVRVPYPSTNGVGSKSDDVFSFRPEPWGDGRGEGSFLPSLKLQEISRASALAIADGLLGALEPFGETVRTAGNQPLPLDDAGAVWRVVAGQVDVFYIQPEPGQARGSRHHLCRVEEGGSIFAMDGVRSTREGELLAVGVGQARLRKFPKADLVRLSLEPVWRRGVADMIDDWIDRISRAIDPGAAPPAVRLEAGAARAVEAGQSASSRGRVTWVHTEGATVRFLGLVTVPECPYGSRFPLSAHAWLTFAHAAEIAPRDTETLMEDGDPWLGLKRFHKVILDAIALARGRDRAVRHARLESTTLRDEAGVSAALAGLSRLAAPHAPAPAPVVWAGDDPLLEACRVVAAALGVEIVAAADGSAGEPLRRIARASGLRTRRVRPGPEWWTADGGPLLGYRAADARPVALVPAPGPAYLLIDPLLGLRVTVTEEVARSLAATAVTFTRALPATRQTVGDLVRFAWPTVRREARAVVVLGVVTGLLGLIAPLVLAVAIDDVIPRADRPQLGLLCTLLVGVGGSIALLQAVQGLALARIKGRLEATLLPAVWDRLLNLPARFFVDHESGDLALRAMGVARVIEVLAGTSVASLLIGAAALLNVVVLVAVNPTLALAAVGLTAVVPLITLAALPALWHCQRAITREQGRISSLLFVLLGGVARLRVAGAEKRAFAHWAGLYRRQLDLSIRFQTLSDRLTVVGDVWPLVVLTAVFATAVGLGPGAIGAGEFLAFNLALVQGMSAVIGVGKTLPLLLNGFEQFDRFRPILDAVPEAADVGGEEVVLGGAIRLSNVSFRYDPDGPLVLDDVSLHVRPGEFVAVVGASGSGKSTLFRLLLGFETPTEGVVAYDGRELFTLDAQEVRRQIGVVLQGAQPFPGDVYSNIVGLNSDLSRADAWEAAELAGLADDLAAMPMGIHTIVGENGGGFSSGQRQRLMIARALAGRPRILLFDEATSALDNRSQAFIAHSLNACLTGTTRLVIAHRLSTVVDADRIYVLREGKVVQCGNYSQLIAEPGPFQDLARRQTLA